jgi:hypothetical protein
MNHVCLTPVKYSQSTRVMSTLFSYPQSFARPVKRSIQELQENKAYLDEHYSCYYIKHSAFVNNSKNHSFTSLITVKSISFISNGVGSPIATTSSMLCLFLDQNKDYHTVRRTGFPLVDTKWSRSPNFYIKLYYKIKKSIISLFLLKGGGDDAGMNGKPRFWTVQL